VKGERSVLEQVDSVQ